MAVRLNADMWSKILGIDVHSEKEERSAEHEVKDGQSVLKDKIVYMLAIEGDGPDRAWRWWERALDAVVQAAQPAPALTHVELFIPAVNEGDDPHFSTYLGKSSGWGSSFGDSQSFYLDPHGNGPAWRAVPVLASAAVERLRKECEKHLDTPYGSAYRLFNYPFAVPPLRSLAWLVADEPGSSAHCAALTARCLRRALPELELANSSAWYGPSTLFLELSRHNRMQSYSIQFEELETLTSTVEQEETATAVETLMRGSDERVGELSDVSCQMAIEMLAKRSVKASISGDTTVERVAQKQLARALLRYSIVQQQAQRRRVAKETRKKISRPVAYEHSEEISEDEISLEEQDELVEDRAGSRGMFRR